MHQLDAALSGFRPSVERLRGMLERVSPGRRRGWLGYARPEEQSYDESGAYGPGPDPSGGYASGPPGPAGPAGSSDPAAGYAPGAGEDWSNAAGDTRSNHHRRPTRSRRSTPPGAPAPNDERGQR